MTLLRGRLDGLEVTLSGRDLEEAFGELEARLARQPSFYQGARAVASFGATVPAAQDLARLRGLLSQAGITLRALCGTGQGLEALAAAEGLQFEVPATTRLSESAQSLVADFAGARTDIAQRRKRGEASVRRAKFETQPRPHPELRLVEALPTTLYHAATLRGGQALHHTGNIVVVGDVNPGAELIATGDVLVFGRLAGTAHAGAQGDEAAHIYALDLAATQLRIATFIAVEDSARPSVGRGPEAALVRAGQIVILPLNSLAECNDARSSLS
ncbi:MAG TPA: septum site-determining protein MinC [Candidatus Babeliales bacterium]|nr:septum site-determining protein MinC [Candidatus Babeliales bacterium]